MSDIFYFPATDQLRAHTFYTLNRMLLGNPGTYKAVSGINWKEISQDKDFKNFFKLFVTWFGATGDVQT